VQARTQGKAQLLCGLAILVALAALLVASPGGAVPSAVSEVAAEAADASALPRLVVRLEPRVARRVAALRGLEFDEVPEPEVVDSEYLNRIAARDARSQGLHRGIAADEAELRMLGLLAPDEQLESIITSTGDLAAAAYDSRSGRLYVVSDAVGANRALVEFVLSHELDHALEDQRFGLGGGAQLDDDAALARMALREGSATALMVEYAGEHLSPAELIAGTAGVDSGTEGIPRFYSEQLMWTYLGGARFAGGLLELAGDWKLVDHALGQRPPASTEQVLHVDKYVHAEEPVPVAVAPAALEVAGWRRADGGVIGEFTTRQLLEVGVDEEVARRAAAGWGGDRYELWRHGTAPSECEDQCRSDLVLVANWRMDSVADARELRDGLAEYLSDGLGASEGTLDVWSLDGSAAALRRTGDAITLVLAPEAKTASEVAADQVGP
jgi:hypothetical protein